MKIEVVHLPGEGREELVSDPFHPTSLICIPF
jgi:hypothetical protein